MSLGTTPGSKFRFPQLELELDIAVALQTNRNTNPLLPRDTPVQRRLTCTRVDSEVRMVEMDRELPHAMRNLRSEALTRNTTQRNG